MRNFNALPGKFCHDDYNFFLSLLFFSSSSMAISRSIKLTFCLHVSLKSCKVQLLTFMATCSQKKYEVFLQIYVCLLWEFGNRLLQFYNYKKVNFDWLPAFSKNYRQHWPRVNQSLLCYKLLIYTLQFFKHAILTTVNSLLTTTL